MTGEFKAKVFGIIDLILFKLEENVKKEGGMAHALFSGIKPASKLAYRYMGKQVDSKPEEVYNWLLVVKSNVDDVLKVYESEYLENKPKS